MTVLPVEISDAEEHLRLIIDQGENTVAGVRDPSRFRTNLPLLHVLLASKLLWFVAHCRRPAANGRPSRSYATDILQRAHFWDYPMMRELVPEKSVDSGVSAEREVRQLRLAACRDYLNHRG